MPNLNQLFLDLGSEKLQFCGLKHEFLAQEPDFYPAPLL